MTTPTNDRQTSERERLVLPMTASMVPHPMYASGWNACLDACKEVLDYQHAEIERLRAENEALRSVAERIEKAPVAIMDTRDVLGICAPAEEDFPALYAMQGHRVRLVRED